MSEKQVPITRFVFTWWLILMLIISAFNIFTVFQPYQVKNVYFQSPSYNETFIGMLETVEKNCGSMFITRKSNLEGLQVFRKDKKGEYEKTYYTPLEDCLQ